MCSVKIVIGLDGVLNKDYRRVYVWNIHGNPNIKKKIHYFIYNPLTVTSEIYSNIRNKTRSSCLRIEFKG